PLKACGFESRSRHQKTDNLHCNAISRQRSASEFGSGSFLGFASVFPRWRRDDVFDQMIIDARTGHADLPEFASGLGAAKAA
ncbi:MAG: hypothetical protein WCA24_00085, partial [Thiomonas sp.]